MAGETVVGVFDREELSAVLVPIHRRRLGSQVRVLDAARGPLEDQLAHAGLPLLAGPELTALGEQAAVVLVSAPGRQDEVAQLFTALGAKAVSIRQPAVIPLVAFGETVRRPAPSPHPALLQADQATGAGDTINT